MWDQLRRPAGFELVRARTVTTLGTQSPAGRPLAPLAATNVAQSQPSAAVTMTAQTIRYGINEIRVGNGKPILF